MTVLEVERLSVRFGAVRACDGIDLRIEAGQLIGIVGPNGSGKTTLFRAVCGEIKPSAGKVVWKGDTITRWSANRIAKSGLVRTFQQSMVFPSVSVGDNLRLAQACVGRSAKRLRDGALSFDAVLSETGLSDFRDAPAGSLPTGLLRMLGIAISLQASPSLLMLDEPGAGLNQEESARLAALLRYVHQAGVTMAIIDHDMGFLLPLCERLVVLQAGTKLVEGPPAEVVANPAVIEVYLGSQFAHGK